ncbi:MAG: MotA/TolQ/ExbB proton channel family protein [Ruminiclostridium sp.]|nr:MotA/TolQ/ExbB proton channel family protein [Ruminiclostridium sp.]
MEFIAVIFKNLFGFDLIIFLAAILNGAVLYFLKKNTDKLRGMMNRTIYVPHFHLSRRQADEHLAALSEEEVMSVHGAVGRLYSLYINITGIFPLLGILGTVVSLLGLVGDMDNVTGNFYAALTSTFWGLVFAILFKFLDGTVSPEIENNDRSVRIFLEQNSSEDIKAARQAPDAAQPADRPEELVPDEIRETDIPDSVPSNDVAVVMIEADADEK